ncbi:DUF6048 family protein [Nonlabens xiamenensis]|uniref:DUF6048 family protein n=1 Tax=Nonlabens xiamenensis TaxID=2341043 RepID=UPI000F606C02|nr:DUF6048 family protein [Nonlabens xiamenensis]
MWKYVISIWVLALTGQLTWAQQENLPNAQAPDSVIYKKTYGLRAGIDLASLIRTGLDDQYSGFQILADFRLSPRLYVAGELGNESLEQELDRVDYKGAGSFLKAGVDYNFYTNWLDMDNMLYGGARLGVASMTQELRRYDYNLDNEYFPIFTNVDNREFDGLSAVWLEIQAGVKVEVLNNLYLTANLQLKRSITQDTPEGFDNLFIPGFGRTFDTSEIGVGYSYGIVYRIPLFKK